MKKIIGFPCLAMMVMALWAGAGACGSSTAPASPTTLPSTSMKIGNEMFTLEIASDQAAREHGLMERSSLPADHGMIFIFPDEIVRHFWMKNTAIPLDIIFLSSSGTVVSVHQMLPFDETLTSSDVPAQAAIELKQGAAIDCGVRIGDKLTMPAATTQP